MKLHLVNEYSSDNLGDALIYESLVKLSAPLTVTSRMEPTMRKRVRGLESVESYSPEDVYVSVGGDIFNNARRLFITKGFVKNVWDLAKRPPERTFLFGQTIPESCAGLSFAALSAVLRRLSSVTVRDEESQRRLKLAGIDASISYDLAFAYRIGVESELAGRALFERAEIDPRRCIILSIRGFNAMYPGDNQKFVDAICETHRNLVKRGHVPAILMQSNVGAEDNDYSIVHELLRRIVDLKILRPLDIPAPFHPIDAFVGAICIAHGVVAVRYHAMVIRLLAGRQAYNLFYSRKGRDLIRRLNQPGSAVAELNPKTIVSMLEKSCDGIFDPAPISKDVSEAFSKSLAIASHNGKSLQSCDKENGELTLNG
jgi:polysaccharide pyruvyl transferase WcaK-like protein